MVDWLERAAARRPEHPALVADGETLTYAGLLDAARAAEPLETLAHPAGLDFGVRLHALLLAGGPIVVHTSGSTGEPKPVALSAGNILHSALGTAAMLGIHPDDRWLCPLPLNHVGGLMVLLRSVIYATTAVIGPHDPEATLASFVPTQLVRGQDEGMPALRAILLGGGPIPPDLRRAGVHETYGMTETTSMAALDGFPLPGVDITIADDGEILVTGPIVVAGAAPTHRTGDLGELRDGRLVVTGRKSETIITGGENVSPAEVEGVLAAHPRVEDAAVVGRADPEWGEALVALVVGEAGEEELRAWCRERLAPFKVPKRVEHVSTLPRTPSGKLLRRAL
jgi:O-succinylbenzoic acid--CoA ligase